MAVESRDAVWSPVLAGIRAEALDCLQANLAAVADLASGPGSHLAFGAPLDLRWAAVDGVPAVTATLADRLAEASDLLGVHVTERHEDLPGPDLRRLAADGPLYVVADAYDMAWLPYAGREHLEHSFLLLDGGVVVDAYWNDTRWGAYRPGVWRLGELDLAATALRLAVRAPAPPDPASVLAANARRAAEADVAGYVEAVRAATGRPGALEQLVLDVWLLSRSRLLHALWLASAAPDRAPAAAGRATDWLTLGSHVYLAMRRGRGTPAPLVSQLEALLRTDTSAAAPAVGAPVPAAVEETLREVLRLAPDVPVTDRPLRDLPNFDSFRLVEVVARLEQRLGVELDLDQLSPEGLRDAGALAEMFARAVGGVR